MILIIKSATFFLFSPRKSLLCAIATIHSALNGQYDNYEYKVDQDVTAIGFDNPAFDGSSLNSVEIHSVDQHLNIRLDDIKFIDQVLRWLKLQEILK